MNVCYRTSAGVFCGRYLWPLLDTNWSAIDCPVFGYDLGTICEAYDCFAVSYEGWKFCKKIFVLFFSVWWFEVQFCRRMIFFRVGKKYQLTLTVLPKKIKLTSYISYCGTLRILRFGRSPFAFWLFNYLIYFYSLIRQENLIHKWIKWKQPWQDTKNKWHCVILTNE